MFRPAGSKRNPTCFWKRGRLLTGRRVASQRSNSSGRDSDDEGPQHQVTLSEGSWLGATPVTQALWKAVMGQDSNQSRFVDDERPVERVNVEDVKSFFAAAEALAPGLTLRLPTEAQWEYACRAGARGPVYVTELWALLGAPALDTIAWYGGNSGGRADSSELPEKRYQHVLAGTRKVATSRRNPWGLYDMLGSVWEWCADAAEEFGAALVGRLYGLDAVRDPFLPPRERTQRVLRRGSWNHTAHVVRAASRPISDTRPSKS